MNCYLAYFAKRNYCLQLTFILVLLAASFAIVACGGRGNPSDAPPAEDVATSGSVQTETGSRNISVSGSLVFPHTASLSFESPGIVGEVMVQEGDAVSSGQPLASLDEQSVSQLQTAVAGAQLAATTAEANLSSLRLEPNIQIANAELEVASAEVALDEAQAALDNLLQRPGINVAGARLAVAQSEIALDKAREQLGDLLQPQRIAISGAEARVAAAKVELDAAQEAYDDIKDGSYPEEVLRDARNGVSFASSALEAAIRGRTDAQAAAQNALMQAEDAEYLIREQYIALFKFWFGTEPTEAELQMTSQEVIDEWGIDLDATFHRFNPDYVDIEPAADDPDTRWFEPTIWAWLNLHLQFWGIVPTCTDEKVLARTERCITRELENGYDALDRARDALAAARNNTDTTTEQTEDAVAAAEAALSDAQDSLKELEEGPDASIIESAEKRLALAHASLQEAEDDLAELTVDIDPLNVALARAALGQSEFALEEANDALERAEDDALHIGRAGKHLDLASVALRDAETRLNEVQGLVRAQIAAAEAELAFAQATLDKAQESLDGAVITSPMDGIVALVSIDVDDPVGDELTVMKVVSTDVVAIEGVIDAEGRPYVNEGASAVVNIDSIGDMTLGGSVSYIGAEARTERGVVSYGVRIHVNVPDGVTVPISLSAASAIITGSDTALGYGEQDASESAFSATRAEPAYATQNEL
jgi:multidrug resistance efflux pump